VHCHRNLDDIDTLARHFLEEWSADARGVAISSCAIEVLKAAAWPGNIRQLRQTIRRAAILADGRTISAVIAREALANGSHAVRPGPLRDESPRDKLALVSLLHEVDWDIAMAALRLEVTKKTVYARLQRYNVAIPDRRRRGTDVGHSQGGSL
jgi:DNA-binding NtrC family response regulator